MKLKVLLQDTLKCLLKAIIIALNIYIFSIFESKLIVMLAETAAVILAIYCVTDLLLIIFDLATIGMKKENFNYWNKFKMLLVDDALSTLAFIGLLVALIITTVLKRNGSFDMITIFIICVLFLGAIFPICCMLKHIKYIKKRNFELIKGTLITKSKYHRSFKYYCEVLENDIKIRINLPEKAFLKSNKQITVGKEYTYQVVMLENEKHLLQIIDGCENMHL